MRHRQAAGWLWGLLGLLVWAGCASGTPAEPPDSADAARGEEVGASDAAPEDAAPEDARAAPDISSPELDTSPEDASPEDAASADASPPEPDAASPEPDAAPAGPRCGDGVREGEEMCDDGNEISDDGCSASCELDWACAPLGGSCASVERSVPEHLMESADGCRFALRGPTGSLEAAADALVARAGGALGLEDILGDLNREGVAGITAQGAERLQNHAWQGFRWNDGDMNTEEWYPQGISTSSDGVASGRLAGRRAMLVSWYYTPETAPIKGARLSLVDLTDLGQVRYRHLLLVEPSLEGGAVDIGPALYDSGGALHAGGIAWYGDSLYVADTARGLRVFDLSRIIRVSHVDDNGRIGVSPGRIDAFGYRYAVPQVARYVVQEGACPVRFSFVGLDRSASPPRLITGEYRADDPSGRLVAWPLDPATGLLEARGGEVRATEAWIGGQTRMQGGLTWEGNVYISSSSQTPSRFGRLYRTRPGLESRITAWPYGCEDLSYEREAGLIWTAAEHPGTRDVVGIPLPPP